MSWSAAGAEQPGSTHVQGSVLVNGPVSWNTLVQLDELPAPHPHMVGARGHGQGLGGTSAGKAGSLARLGVPVALRTVLGTDADAARIRTALDHPDLSILGQVVDGPSEHHLNLMAGPDRLSIYLDAAPDPGPAPPAVLEALAQAPLAVLDLAPHSVELLAAARAAGTETWCDLHDDDGVSTFHEPFRAADVVVVSADRLDDLEGYLHERVAAGARWAVGTRGAQGAVAVTPGAVVEVSAVPAEVVDTNGAGDAFVAGLVAGRLAGLDLPGCLTWAVAAGALCVAAPGLVADLDLATVRRSAARARVTPR